MISHTGKNKSICGIYSCVINAYLLFGFHYSPLKVSWNHFTTAKGKTRFCSCGCRNPAMRILIKGYLKVCLRVLGEKCTERKNKSKELHLDKMSPVLIILL